MNNSEFDFPKAYINPHSIDSISITKETANGEVYIFIKKQDFKLLTLKELLKKHSEIDEIDSSLLFQINGKYVTDIDGITFDDSYFVYLKITDLTHMQYISDSYKPLRIVEIELDINERAPVIRVRGARAPAPFPVTGNINTGATEIWAND